MLGYSFLARASAVVLYASLAWGSPLEEREVDERPVNLKTIYVPPANYRTPKTLYGRTVQLANGDLLATWENYSPEPPQVYFPIYKSTNKGKTWKPFSTIHDTVNGWGLRYQPDLYLLPQRIGKLAAGTILAAGNSIPSDLGLTKIDIYASTDSGKTWKFVSSVANGGRAIPNNGETPVWEPFLIVYDDKLVVYYSDQGDPRYGQNLVHKVSSDGVNWSKLVPDVNGDKYEQRPGMTTVARLANGKWIMTFEYGGAPGSTSSGYQFPVHYKIADSPLKFNAVKPQLLSAGGVVPNGSPYVVTSTSGGRDGTIIVSAGSNSEIFVNTKLGDPDAWVVYKTPQPMAYTRHLRVLDNPDWLLILSAGALNGDNDVTCSVLKLPNL